PAPGQRQRDRGDRFPQAAAGADLADLACAELGPTRGAAGGWSGEGRRGPRLTPPDRSLAGPGLGRARPRLDHLVPVRGGGLDLVLSIPAHDRGSVTSR